MNGEKIQEALDRILEERKLEERKRVAKRMKKFQEFKRMSRTINPHKRPNIPSST